MSLSYRFHKGMNLFLLSVVGSRPWSSTLSSLYTMSTYGESLGSALVHWMGHMSTWTFMFDTAIYMWTTLVLWMKVKTESRGTPEETGLIDVLFSKGNFLLVWFLKVKPLRCIRLKRSCQNAFQSHGEDIPTLCFLKVSSYSRKLRPSLSMDLISWV